MKEQFDLCVFLDNQLVEFSVIDNDKHEAIRSSVLFVYRTKQPKATRKSRSESKPSEP